MKGRHIPNPMLMTVLHVAMSEVRWKALTWPDDRRPLPGGELIDQLVASKSFAKPDTMVACSLHAEIEHVNLVHASCSERWLGSSVYRQQQHAYDGNITPTASRSPQCDAVPLHDCVRDVSRLVRVKVSAQGCHTRQGIGSPGLCSSPAPKVGNWRGKPCKGARQDPVLQETCCAALLPCALQRTYLVIEAMESREATDIVQQCCRQWIWASVPIHLRK